MGLSPTLSRDENRFSASTPTLARLLWLFSYARRVTVDRATRRITVTTRRLWLWQQTRVIDFDRVSRIICTGQAIPSLLFWRYLAPDSDTSEAAFFLISLALKDRGNDVALFTIWEDQPSRYDWLDRLAGAAPNEARVGDEDAVRIVDLLHDYLRVPIARH